jgi:protein tyrosine/serine phosphatase
VKTADGRETRWGAVVRSASPAFLTASGWSALHAHGIRTIIDLTNDGECWPDAAPRPGDIATVKIPLDPVDDTEFWDYWSQGLHGTPLYYRPYLDRYPERTARVASAIAHAEPGGVFVHCRTGRDRTGVITLLLLSFAGVAPEEIADDHARSHERLRPMFDRLGVADQEPMINAALENRGTTPRETLLATLDAFDAVEHLRLGGLGDNTVRALRTRLLATE